MPPLHGGTHVDFASNRIVSQIVTVPIAEYILLWRTLETRPSSSQFGPILALNRQYLITYMHEYNKIRVVKHRQL
jgi:hypothetical protein